MFFGEVIVLFSSIYLAFISGVYCECLASDDHTALTSLVLLFEAYPIIFQDIYGMGLVSVGLAYLPSKLRSLRFCYTKIP